LLAAAPAGVWLDVPFVQQEKEGCGAASAAMVMQYWLRAQGKPAGGDADVKQIQNALQSKARHGIYASELERYLQQHGFRTFAFAGSWDDLEQHLAKGRPLIVALKPVALKPVALKPASSAELHYVVVVGLDSEQAAELNVVLLNDPAQRKLLKQARSTFEKQWSAAGRWLLLALPESSQALSGLHVDSQNESHTR
jgi:ABC-type bacteriocin/lantibiotic exporter with double-glycine peptidase domain